VANSPENHSDLDYTDTLWQAADKLRGTVDAAEYKHVVLGLLFLKYISDSFESRRVKFKEELEKEGIQGQHLESLLESRDEYTAERVFWVPLEARWLVVRRTRRTRTAGFGKAANTIYQAKDGDRGDDV
jgi:type I restriction enzyme M protein